MISRISGQRLLAPEIKNRLEGLIARLPPGVDPKINRIIVTDQMITKYGAPGAGYSAMWIESERIMKLHYPFNDTSFYHEAAHAVYPNLSEKEVEALGRKWAEESRGRSLSPTSSASPGGWHVEGHKWVKD